MPEHITPEQAELLADLLATATAVARSTGDELPPPDYLDDRDVYTLMVLQAARGLVQLDAARDDLANGLLSDRLRLVVARDAVELLERRPSRPAP